MEGRIVENIWIKTEIRKEENERTQTKMKHKTHTNKKQSHLMILLSPITLFQRWDVTCRDL